MTAIVEKVGLALACLSGAFTTVGKLWRTKRENRHHFLLLFNRVQFESFRNCSGMVDVVWLSRG